MTPPDLYLASSSPRRRELLAQLGLRFEVVTQAVAEIRLPGESPEDYVRRLALDKARAGRRGLPAGATRPVLGSDTAVVVDGDVLGKPADRADALAMLARLSGRAHRVLSAVALVGGDAPAGADVPAGVGQDRGSVRLCESRVWFRDITAQERLAYWASGEPADKAGGYAIQGLGAIFVERLEGSYSGVMGLPLFETAELLQACGIRVLPVSETG